MQTVTVYTVHTMLTSRWLNKAQKQSGIKTQKSQKETKRKSKTGYSTVCMSAGDVSAFSI